MESKVTGVEGASPVTVARSDGPRGEVVLRRRVVEGTAVDELVINGAFAMDSAETTTERALGALAAAVRRGARVLIGGLGLGYTAAEVLRHDIATVDVVEIEPALVGWARSGVTDTLRRVGSDPRVRLVNADILTVLTGTSGAGTRPGTGWDLIVLDVDNGPDFLIHPGNAVLYDRVRLAATLDRVRPWGLLAIWCQGPSPALQARLHEVAAEVSERRYDVRRGSRSLTYAIYTARPGRPADPGPRPVGHR